MEHKSKDTKGSFKIAQSAVEKGKRLPSEGMNSTCVLERKEGSEINYDCKSGACSLSVSSITQVHRESRPVQETPSTGSIWLLTLGNYVSV